MSYHIYFFLKKDKPDKQNTLPIYCRIRLDANDRVDYYTQIRIHKEIWLDKPTPNKDGTLKYIKGSSPLVGAYNKRLNLISARVLEKYNEVLKTGELTSAKELKKVLTGDAEKITLSQLFKEASRSKKNRTKDVFKSRCNQILAFMQEEYKTDLPVDTLTHNKYRAFPLRFENWLDKKGKSKNYKKGLFSALNSAYKYAVKSGYANNNPFHGYELNNKGVTEGRAALNFQELTRFEGFELEDPNLQRIKELFLFQAYTGLSYIDIKQASKENLVIDANGKTWIIKHRQKTGGASKIPLINKAMKILNKHKSEDRKTLFDIPIPHEYNTTIREIGAKAGIKCNGSNFF